MESKLAERMKRVGFSPTLKISAKAKAMQAEGIDVIDLSVGEPDFPTPRHIREAATRAMEAGFTKYTAAEGLIQLRRAIARKLKDENGLKYDPSTEIIVSCGAKASLYHLLLATVNKDEEVIVPSPYWVSYPEMIGLAKGIPVYVPTREQNGFRLTAKELKAAVSASTKAVILNNPCNPTGTAYTRNQLLEVCEAAAEEDLLIIADEIYEKLVYDGLQFVSVAALSPALKARTVVVNGMSKAYSMTGWRIGYAAGPADIIGAMGRLQSHTTSNATTVAQMAAIEALEGPQDEISRMREEFLRRRNAMHARLMTIPGISCHRAEGAFYLFPNVTKYYDMECDGTPIRNSYGLAYHLLRHAHVAVVPGDSFGSPNHIRLSYATSYDRVVEAVDRIAAAIAKLRPARAVKQKALQNTVTKVKGTVETDAGITVSTRDAMVAEADEFLKKEPYFEWNANIAGLIVQLRTNSPHLYDFYVENFFPSPLESDIEPHGILYGVNWIPGKDVKAWYNSETRTGFLMKSAWYGQLRSLALGLATDVGERIHDLHGVRAMVAEVGGRGLMLLGPEGTGKTGHLVELLNRADGKLVSTDYVFVRHSGGDVLADTPERKFYVSTDMAEKLPLLEPLFDRSKCENVATSKEECENHSCPHAEACPLERGEPYCFLASPASRAMLDPYWIGGNGKHVKRTALKAAVLLRRDPIAKDVEKLDAETAARYVEEGRDHLGRSMPFLNPHLLVRSLERTELQRRNYQRLFKRVPCYAVNVARLTVKEVHKAILKAVGL